MFPRIIDALARGSFIAFEVDKGGGGGGTPAGGDNPNPDVKTFTQADIDRIVETRLNQDRRDRPSDDEIQQLRDRAQKADDLEAAEQTEIERLQGEIEKLKGERDDALEDSKTAKGQVKESQRRSKIIAAAAAAGAKDPDAVYALLKEDGFKAKKGDETFEVTIGDDGQVTGLDDAIPAFLEAKAYLVGEPPKPADGGGGVRTPTSGALTKDQLAQMTPQEVAAQKPEDVRQALSEG